jgi:DNA repair protein RadC
MNIDLSKKDKIKVMNSKMVYEVMKKILLRENEIERDHEHVWVVCLAANNKILNIELVSLGSVDETTLKPMQVFRIAIQKGAVKIIMIHNHPSGDLFPSTKDRDITDRMIQVGIIVNVEVIDHMIISLQDYYSFDDHKLMKELRDSKKWVPRYKEEEKIRKEALKIGKTEGRKEGRKEGKKAGREQERIKIAKKALKKGTPIEFIAELTGLSIEEIEELE